MPYVYRSRPCRVAALRQLSLPLAPPSLLPEAPPCLTRWLSLLLPQYLDYKGLKKFLKKRTDDGRDWTDVDEVEFIRELETELDKVAGFQDRKVSPHPDLAR